MSFYFSLSSIVLVFSILLTNQFLSCFSFILTKWTATSYSLEEIWMNFCWFEKIVLLNKWLCFLGNDCILHSILQDDLIFIWICTIFTNFKIAFSFFHLDLKQKWISTFFMSLYWISIFESHLFFSGATGVPNKRDGITFIMNTNSKYL